MDQTSSPNPLENCEPADNDAYRADALVRPEQRERQERSNQPKQLKQSDRRSQPGAQVRVIDEKYNLEDIYAKHDIFLSGTQALVRLVLEQARHDHALGLNTGGFISGYRGSPLAAFDKALLGAKKHLSAENIHFQPAINEELAATALFGSQQISDKEENKNVEGVFGVWYGKGPGVDRAGDALKHGNAMGTSPKGGVLALLGDDHGCVSSSMPHQSDQALASFMMPVLHPGHVQDYISFGLFALAASRFSGAWVGMKVISEILESSTTVQLSQDVKFTEPGEYSPPPFGLHYDGANNFGPILEQKMLARLDAFRAFAAANPVDKPGFGAPQPKLALIGVGKAYFDLLEALRQIGIDEAKAKALGLGVYKVGLTWPIEPKGYLAYLAKARHVIIVEEKRALVESQLKELYYNREDDHRPVILGKQDESGAALFAEQGELRASHIIPGLNRILPQLLGDAFQGADDGAPKDQARLPDFLIQKRTPYFCSGCPHNRSTKLPEGSSAMPGIGCHYMASWMGRETQGLVQMGGEGASAISSAPFGPKRHVFQNLGDGTYFHSGLLALRQAVAAKNWMTYKILYNDAVAMTGGQPIDGSLTVENIVDQIRAEGVHRIAIVSENPKRFGSYFARRRLTARKGITLHHRDEMPAIQDEMRQVPGVSAIIYDQGCAAEKRRKRKKGMLEDPKKRVFIQSDVCEGCGDCSAQANCISIMPQKTEWGVKRQIDQSSCNKDYSCVKGFCPSFITIEGDERAAQGQPELRAKLLEAYKQIRAPEDEALPQNAEILITGVGGTGIVTIGAILAMAAHLEGKGSSVLDFMGFAQKGGAVMSHLKIVPQKHLGAPVRIDQAKADLMIGCDMVVATMADALGTLSARRSRIVLNSAKMPTADFVLNGVSDLQHHRRVKTLKSRAVDLSEQDFTQIARDLFGDSLYANMMIVGYAWQNALLPLSHSAICRAIELNGKSVDDNLAAFKLGRLLAAREELFTELNGAEAQMGDESDERAGAELINARADYLADYHDADYAQSYRQFMRPLQKLEQALGTDRFTKSVAQNLARLMAYKDEYEIARLHLSQAQLAQMRARFHKGGKVKFHLAPPVLAFWKDGNGRPRKFAIPAWAALPVFRLLDKMRPLRGTRFDIFAALPERRAEKKLIENYKALIVELSAELEACCRARSAAELAAELQDLAASAAHIAGLVDKVRGYGPVRAAAIKTYETAIEQALRERPSLEEQVLQAAFSKEHKDDNKVKII